MNTFLRRVFATAIALLFALGSALPVFALGDVETRTVRVGFYYTEGYHMMDENGERSGYGYEILQAMKLYNNWVYEYVGYDKGWADIQKMILDGEVDIAVSAIKTPARMELYDFSDRVIGQSGACLMVKAGESPYVAGDYENYNGMRIGFIENAAQIASTEAFAEEKGFTFEPVYYKTSDELEQAIASGKDVDAIVTSNLRLVAGTRQLELYAMQDIHAMVKKGNSELLKEINFALEQISLYNPGLYDSLYKKYYSVDAGDDVFFSPDEREFIADCKESGSVLRAAIVPDMSPYSYFENGKPKGILYDIPAEILHRTGLEFELIAVDSEAEYRELIEDKGVDIRMAARFDYNYAEKLGYTLIDPYYSTDVSRVMLKSQTGSIDTVAVVRDSTIDAYYLPTVITDETVFRYDTLQECVSAVLSGKCDVLYLLTRTAQEVVYSEETNRLTSVIMPRFSISYTMGIRDNADSRLASILEKAASSMSEDDVAEFVLKYTDYSARPMSLLGILYNNPILFIGFVVLLLVLIFIAVMMAFVSRKRRLEREKNVLLQDALDSAEQANSAKSVFMSRMSHEIRTPLNAIIGYNSISSSTLADAKNETEYRHAAMKAMDCLSKSDIASKHLLTVINDVLDMSAIESEKIRIAHEPFDFKGMLSSLTTMFSSQAMEKDTDFEVIYETSVEDWLVGDQMRTQQILTNLLSNAVKFTPAGGKIRLSVAQTQISEAGANMRFEIMDTGIGMSKDFMKNIWTPFEQADASISRRFGGTGLGLAITKTLVDLMGGTVCVESEPGVGSTFTVNLPFGRMVQPAVDQLHDYSDINVLVVDDDRGACDYMKLLFDRAGTRCTSVASGEDAVAAVASGLERHDPYTLCVIDWQMPGTDGMETVKNIRKIANPELQIIVVSAHDYSGIETLSKNIGVNELISKPLFQQTVLELLAEVSGKSNVVAYAKTTEHDFGGARILLAEDNLMNMEVAKAILSSWNLAVDEAWNGQEAVDMFCSAPAGTYKAILMDIHMPEIDGYRATKMIRQSNCAEAAAVPIIAMTADVFTDDVSEALAAGMNDHIGKPIEKNTLLDTLRKYIQ